MPGLAAKPTIDILVVVHCLNELDECDDSMMNLGYVPKGEFGIPGRRFYSDPLLSERDDPRVPCNKVLIGKSVEALSPLKPRGFVEANASRHSAFSHDGTLVEAGERLIVVDMFDELAHKQSPSPESRTTRDWLLQPQRCH